MTQGTGSAKVKQRPKKPQTLAEFVMAKKRAGCKVCQLPIDVVAQVKSARDKRIPRPVVLEWLAREHGIKLSPADLDTHINGRHENGYSA